MQAGGLWMCRDMEQIVTAYQLEPNALSEVISTLPHTQCWLNIDYGGHADLFPTAAAAIRCFHKSDLKKHTHTEIILFFLLCVFHVWPFLLFMGSMALNHLPTNISSSASFFACKSNQCTHCCSQAFMSIKLLTKTNTDKTKWDYRCLQRHL